MGYYYWAIVSLTTLPEYKSNQISGHYQIFKEIETLKNFNDIILVILLSYMLIDFNKADCGPIIIGDMVFHH